MVFGKKGVGVGFVVPGVFAEEIVDKVVVDVAVGFTFEVVSGDIGRCLFEIERHRFGRGGGDPDKGGFTEFAEIVPEPHFVVELFGPGDDFVEIPFLSFGVVDSPGTTLSHHDDEIVGELDLGDVTVGIVCHHGDKTGNFGLFDTVGDLSGKGPHEFSGIVVAGLKNLLALGAAAAVVGILRHDVGVAGLESGGVPAGSACTGLDAPFGSPFAGKETFHILKDLFPDTGGVAEGAGVGHGKIVVALAVVKKGEIVRIALGKTVDVTQP